MTEEFDFNKLPIFCTHFNGLKFGDKTKKCNAGVAYEDVVQNEPNWLGSSYQNWPYSYPCIRGSQVFCSLRTFGKKKEFTEW